MFEVLRCTSNLHKQSRLIIPIHLTGRPGARRIVDVHAAVVRIFVTHWLINDDSTPPVVNPATRALAAHMQIDCAWVRHHLLFPSVPARPRDRLQVSGRREGDMADGRERTAFTSSAQAYVHRASVAIHVT